jgi:CRISPR/Cas system CSM-associated protein Csm3 (group 7 of RAMP superfamily)
MENKNPIIRRYYIKGQLQAVSPLVIGSGEDERTDIDLVRDARGNPFIPGAALAGVLRHFTGNRLEGENGDEHPAIKSLFGKTGKDSTLSLLMISDSILHKNSTCRVTVRDGLELDPSSKTVGTHKNENGRTGAGAKYDYEVIEPGAVFDLKMEMIIRENNRDTIDSLYDVLAFILHALANGSLAPGAKTRRGFGKIRLEKENLRILKLDMRHKPDVEKWIDFDWRDWNFEPNMTLAELTPKILNFETQPRFTVSAAFTIPYSILIRHYNVNPAEEDTVHLKSNGKCVIPGTSWNGALRQAIYSQLHYLTGNETRTKNILKILFGEIDPQNNKARASRVLIEESIIHKKQEISYTRNKVDRFTGGVVESALFTEKPVYGGTVTLNIILEKPKDWEKGLLLLGLKDIANGIQSVGGGANIGRGILQSEYGDIKIDGEPLTPEMEKTCFKALYHHLKKGETNGPTPAIE